MDGGTGATGEILNSHVAITPSSSRASFSPALFAWPKQLCAVLSTHQNSAELILHASNGQVDRQTPDQTRNHSLPVYLIEIPAHELNVSRDHARRAPRLCTCSFG